MAAGKKFIVVIIIATFIAFIVTIISIIVVILNAYKYSVNNNLYCKENGGDCEVEYKTFEKISYPKELHKENIVFSKTLGKFFAKLIINWNCNVSLMNVENPLHITDKLIKKQHIHLKLDGSPIFGVLLENDNIAIILFRGTSTKKEWALNRKTIQTKFSHLGDEDLMIHRGFNEFFNMILPQMRNILQSIDENKRIIFTGHSLGGVMSVLYSVFARFKFHRDVYCFNFGKPRIGNEEWQKKVDSEMKDRIFRIGNEDDLITNLPPSVTMNLKNPKKPGIFRHEGRYIYISANKRSLALNHSIYLILENLRSNKFVEIDKHLS